MPRWVSLSPHSPCASPEATLANALLFLLALPAPSQSASDSPPAVDPSAPSTAAHPTNPSSVPPAPAPVTPTDGGRPRLTVQLATVNSTDHLKDVKRQAGGIGSSAFDVKQQSMRDFISGGGNAKV